MPDAPPAAPLEGALTTDWLVIGAGFAGLAAARRLAQWCPGDRISVLDATRVGAGPAGRNSGFMIDLPHDLSSADYGGALDRDRATIADNRQAIQFAADMAADLNLPPEAFAPVGKINGAASARGVHHNENYASHLKRLDEPYERLDAAQMTEVTGSTYYTDGLFTPGTVMIQPGMFVRGVAEGLVSNRVRLYENSPVTDLTRVGKTWVASTPRGRITAPAVILAVNGMMERFGLAQGRLVHVLTYASMTRALTEDEVTRLGGQATWGLTPADPLGTTVRRISGMGGDRIVIRNTFTYDPEMEVSAHQLTRVTAKHDRALAVRFPQLAGVEMAYRWGGRLCLAQNGVQAIGQPKPGLFTACIQNGLGTVRGTLAGMLAADLATGHPSDALDRALAEPAPQRLPPWPLARLGASLRLGWGHWRAGREL